MTTHLTQEQISAAILGEVSERSRQHLLDCHTCRAEVTRFEGDLALFGRTVRSWSDAVFQEPAGAETFRQSRWSFPQFASAGLATAVLVLIFVLAGTSYLHRGSPQPDPVTDAALLTQVDAALVRTVPASMEPLSRIVAVDPSDKTNP